MPDYSSPIAQARLRISDRLRFEQETLLGDGLLASFKLKQGSPYSTITAATAYLLPSNAATGATFDTDLGRITFAGAISANSAVQAQYSWSVFSDDELSFMYYSGVGGGNVAGVALQAVKILMFDGLKRARWMAPDGTQYDDTAAIGLLKTMYSAIYDELRDDDSAGGIESWGDQQGNYGGPYS